MVKNKGCIFFPVLLLVLLSNAFAEVKPIDTGEIEKTFQVLIDASTAIVATVSDGGNKNLPGCSISMSQKTGLPVKATFLLSDISELVGALKPKGYDDSHGFWANVFNLPNKTINNPFLTAAFMQLSSRNYQKGEYVLTGLINIVYPEGFSISCLISNNEELTCMSGPINIEIRMTLLGDKIDNSITLIGKFRITKNEEEGFDISPSDTYTINGHVYSGGSIHLSGY